MIRNYIIATRFLCTTMLQVFNMCSQVWHERMNDISYHTVRLTFNFLAGAKPWPESF
jgi:hypothetical protein